MSLPEGMLFAKDALWGVFILFCFISILEVCDFMTWHLVVVLRVLEWHQETVGLVWLVFKQGEVSETSEIFCVCLVKI